MICHGEHTHSWSRSGPWSWSCDSSCTWSRPVGVHGLADRVRDGVLLGVLRGLRPCEHAVQVPAVCADDSGCALPSVHRQSWTFLLCSYSANCASDRRVFQVLLLDRFLTCPLLCNATCTVLGCQGRRHFRRGADAISYGSHCSEKHRDFPVAVH